MAGASGKAKRLAISVVVLLTVLLGTARGNARAQGSGSAVIYPAGWNLIAAPPGSDLSGALPPLFTLQSGDATYENIDPSQTAEAAGYWAYFPVDTTVALAAGDASPYTVQPPAGQYVMLGNPSGTVAAQISGADLVYRYDPVNGYQRATTLLPGQGAWVESGVGGPITITPLVPAPAPTAVAPAPAPVSAPQPAPVIVPAPATSPSAPAGATAICNDGTYSFSAHRRGTCSSHGGVAQFLVNLPP